MRRTYSDIRCDCHAASLPVYFDTRTGGQARHMTGAIPDPAPDSVRQQGRVEYIGDGPLEGKTALAMDSYKGEPAPDGFRYLQFDDLELMLDGIPICYGWHLFQTALLKDIK